MKNYNKVLVAGLMLAALGCNKTPEFVELESGLKFRKLEEGDTTRAHQGDVMNMVMTHTLGDSVLYDSGSEMGFYVNPMNGLPDNLRDAFLMCGVGDSVQIQMSYPEYASLTGRPLTPADSALVVNWNIRVREIDNEQAVVERLQSEQLDKDQTIIDEYLVNNNLEAEKTEDGIAVGESLNSTQNASVQVGGDRGHVGPFQRSRSKCVSWIQHIISSSIDGRNELVGGRCISSRPIDTVVEDDIGHVEVSASGVDEMARSNSVTVAVAAHRQHGQLAVGQLRAGGHR